MRSAHAGIDLDDAAGLLGADRNGLLRAAAGAGAGVRATAAAVDEGALASVADGSRPRTVVWLSGRGTADTAGAMLAAVAAGQAGEPFVAVGVCPPWIGPLDVLIVAGDDPADPALVGGAATAVHRGARVVVAAPYEGPLRDATAARAAVLEPRLWMPDEFGLCRYLAVGLAVLSAVDPGADTGTDLTALADDLDAEALRDSAGREVFTNPAKALAGRLSGRMAVLSGDSAPTIALARHAAAVLLRVAGQPVAAVGLTDAIAALRSGVLGGTSGTAAADIFHDEEFDGPLPGRPRVVALTLAADRQLVAARTAGLDDVDLLGCQDVGDAGSVPAGTGAGAAGAVQQLAILALRLEMTAVYLRLAGG